MVASCSQHPWGPELASQRSEGLGVKEAAPLGWEGGEFQDIGPGAGPSPTYHVWAHTGLIVGTEDLGQGLGWSTRLLVTPRPRKGCLPDKEPKALQALSPLLLPRALWCRLCSLLQGETKARRGEGLGQGHTAGRR